MTSVLTPNQRTTFEADSYILTRKFFDAEETGLLQSAVGQDPAIPYAIARCDCNGSLNPTSAIHEPLIAEHVGVSLTPVREALQRLRGDGLVIIRKQWATFVAPIDLKRVEEGMLVREALEPRVIEIAATQLSDR
ncbi:MAG: DNA-binding GntR family transcriptional regulator [Gammaproteobacteria bacterium]|jgi:DNA-binding GntR family transcriptional regulator